jgi:hypothetical protein
MSAAMLAVAASIPAVSIGSRQAPIARVEEPELLPTQLGPGHFRHGGNNKPRERMLAARRRRNREARKSRRKNRSRS